MRIQRLFPLLLVLASISLVACGDSGDDETTAVGGAEETVEESAAAPPTEGASERAPSGEAVRSAKVEIKGFAYEPAKVTIQAGGKVTWQNLDSTEHTATLDDGSFTTGALAEGKLKSQSFKTPGTYAYHCEIHPEMTGTVEVEPG